MSIITPGALNAGQIVTANLAADSVDATKIDFGTGTNQVDTDVLTEGSTNLYHTSERVDDRVNALLTAGTNMTLTYDDSANTLTVTGLTDAAIVGKVLVSSHSGNIVLGSDANVTISAGSDSGEFAFVDAKQSFIGMTGVGLQFDFDNAATPKTAKISTYGNDIIEIDEKLKVDGHLEVTGAQVDFSGLPTSDPSVAGRLYNDSGTVKISAG